MQKHNKPTQKTFALALGATVKAFANARANTQKDSVFRIYYLRQTIAGFIR